MGVKSDVSARGGGGWLFICVRNQSIKATSRASDVCLLILIGIYLHRLVKSNAFIQHGPFLTDLSREDLNTHFS